jgi:hypothetical protein
VPRPRPAHCTGLRLDAPARGGGGHAHLRVRRCRRASPTRRPRRQPAARARHPAHLGAAVVSRTAGRARAAVAARSLGGGAPAPPGTPPRRTPERAAPAPHCPPRAQPRPRAGRAHGPRPRGAWRRRAPRQARGHPLRPCGPSRPRELAGCQKLVQRRAARNRTKRERQGRRGGGGEWTVEQRGGAPAVACAWRAGRIRKCCRGGPGRDGGRG